MKLYIHSSYEPENEYANAYADAPTIYGYKFFSTMTGITIMFCNEDEDYLKEYISVIYKFLVEDEFGSEEYQSYCDAKGIAIVDDEYGDLIEANGDWIAEIDGVQYKVIVIAEDRGRF